MIECVLEEIRVLKEIHGKKPRFNDAQGRLLAAKAKKIRYGKLKEIANIATPQTLFRRFRSLVVKNFDSSGRRRVGHPPTRGDCLTRIVFNSQCSRSRSRSRLVDEKSGKASC